MKKVIALSLLLVTIWLSIASSALANEVKVMVATEFAKKGENCSLVSIEKFSNNQKTSEETLKSMAQKGWKVAVFKEWGADAIGQYFMIIFEK